MADGVAEAAESKEERPLPDAEAAREWLEAMLLIRRFEERAGEMYAKAKVGGFLHLAIGEEATIIGAVRAMRDEDYLLSAYRSHGHALARGTSPNGVMAELFGREGGVCRGRGGSMHMFDAERRFLGGYGIVGGNLPIGAGVALTADYLGTEDVCVCNFGDGASNQGTFGETMNLAALWKLPVVFLVSNNQFGMGTALERHSAVTDLQVKGEGFGVPGMECDGMDVVDTHRVMTEALRRAREDRQPVLVEAITYRFRGHSMADPEEYRTKEQVKEWRERDPIESFAKRLDDEGVLDRAGFEELDEKVTKRMDDAVAFADDSPFPSPESLYDNVYVLGDQLRGWYAIDERGPGLRKGEDIADGPPEEAGDTERFEAVARQAKDSGEDEKEKPTDEAQGGDDEKAEDPSGEDG